jgi:acyl carrier protein
MGDKSITETLTNILVDKVGLEPHEISNESKLRDDLGLDSLDIIEIIMELEKEYIITIPDEFHEKVSTVNDAIEYITKLIK